MDTSDKRSRVGPIALWVLSGLLAVLFLLAGGSKLAGAQQHLEHFSKWGYPDWFRFLVGAVEVAAGVALLVPRAAFLASLALVVVMAGAVYTHFRFDEAAQAIFPMVLLALIGLIGYMRWPRPRKAPI